MRTLLMWLLLALPAACHDSYLSRDQARAIRTIAPIVLVQDTVSVSKYWTVRTIVFDTHRTKDGKTYQVSREETTTRSNTFVSPADFRIQDDILAALGRNLSPRYEVVPFAGDAAALRGLIGTTKLHPRGKTFAEKLKETRPPGRVDAYLVVHGPSADLVIDVGESSPRSVGIGAARLGARYAYYLIDGRSFEIMAATGACLARPARTRRVRCQSGPGRRTTSGRSRPWSPRVSTSRPLCRSGRRASATSKSCGRCSSRLLTRGCRGSCATTA
jgi:hypothetical protein